MNNEIINCKELIGEILGGLYKPEEILSQDLSIIDHEKYQVTFVFPLYERTVEQLYHVSNVQIAAAKTEGLYLAIGCAIKEGLVEGMETYEDFINNRPSYLLYKENITYRKMLEFNKPYALTFSINEIGLKKIRKTFKSVKIKISGFLSGEIELLSEI